MALSIATIMALLCIGGIWYDRHMKAVAKLNEQIEIRKRFGK